MPTDCQAPSLQPQLSTSAPTNRSSFLIPKPRQRRAPPTSCPLQTFNSPHSNRKHGRSSSFGGFVSKMLPSNREGRGFPPRVEHNFDIDKAASNNATRIHEQPNLRKEIGDDGGARKTKSWSPSKLVAVVYGQGELDNPESALSFGPRDGGTQELIGSNLLQPGVNKTEQTGGNWRTIFDCRKLRPYIIQRKPVSKEDYAGRQGIFRVEKTAASESVFGAPRPEAVHLPVLPPLVNFSDEKQVTKAQQIFDSKKAFREQRRSLRESGDFIGVTGANPRTGYYDSDNTTSSQPSQVSDETKRKLDQQAHETAERKRQYDEAQAKLKADLERVQKLRDNKRIAKAEQRQQVSRQRQRARGKWKLSENGWSSVAEPELSPIEQSLAGSPKADLAPGDRLFPMPSAADPAPYITTAAIAPQDYFGDRVSLSPFVYDLIDQNNEGNSLPKITRKPVGTPPRRQLNKSSETIIHTDISRNQSPPAKIFHVQHQSETRPIHRPEPATELPVANSQILHAEQTPSFLGTPAQRPEPGGLLERKATAISYRSLSMKPVLIHQPRVQSQKALVLEARTSSIDLNHIPAVMLKDPVVAQIPSSNPGPKGSLPVWAEPTQVTTEPNLPVPFINTSTITTTGLAPHPGRVIQFDGLAESQGGFQARVPLLQHKTARSSLRQTSPQNDKQNTELRGGYQHHLASTVTSSEHQLEHTRKRIARLCPIPYRETEQVYRKNTPISTSTFPKIRRKVEPARSAAVTAFQDFRQRYVTKNSEFQRGDSLSPPKMRKAQTSSEKRVAHSGKGGIEDRSMASGRDDKLITGYPQPIVRIMGKDVGKGLASLGAKTGDGALLHVKTALRRPPRTKPSIGRFVLGVIQSIWLLVEPVFDPESDLRRRLQKQRLTWKDASLIVAAAFVVATLMLVFAVAVRILGTGWGVVRSFGSIVGLLAGL